MCLLVARPVLSATDFEHRPTLIQDCQLLWTEPTPCNCVRLSYHTNVHTLSAQAVSQRRSFCHYSIDFSTFSTFTQGCCPKVLLLQLCPDSWLCVQGHLQFFMKEHDEAMKTYEQGLSHDKDNSELREGLMRCQQAINKVHLSFGHSASTTAIIPGHPTALCMILSCSPSTCHAGHIQSADSATCAQNVWSGKHQRLKHVWRV